MKERLTFGVIGETGQLARALKRELSSSCHQGNFLNRKQCDLSGNSEAIENALQAFSSADILIIAAAYTQVDDAEEDEDVALAVNAIAPGIIAAWAAEKNIPVIYISTDYVFDGASKTPYMPHIPTNPINVYGRSKSLGEQAVRAAQSCSAILRTSWLYDGTGTNFVTKMIERAQMYQRLDVVSDQIGRPTYAGHLAQAIIVFAQGLASNTGDFRGTFHISGKGAPTNWADFAREIFKVFSEELSHEVIVNEVTSEAFRAAAIRPKYSILDLSKTEALLGGALPDWHMGIKAAKRERYKNG